MSEPQFTYKICLFGEVGVGKTTLVKRYLTGLFESNIRQTLGAELFVKFLEIEGSSIVLQIWDFAGEDMFRDLLPAYSAGANAGIFMYDLSRPQTLHKLDDWLSIFKDSIEVEKDVPILMVGGKLDLVKQKERTSQAAIDLKKLRSLFDYMECSALTGENVQDIFSTLTKEILIRKGILQTP